MRTDKDSSFFAMMKDFHSLATKVFTGVLSPVEAKAWSDAFCQNYPGQFAKDLSKAVVSGWGEQLQKKVIVADVGPDSSFSKTMNDFFKLATRWLPVSGLTDDDWGSLIDEATNFYKKCESSQFSIDTAIALLNQIENQEKLQKTA